MSKYYIKAIILNGCPYSKNAEALLKSNSIPSDINYINHNEKNTFKSDLISTFPQLYLKKYNKNGNLLLGGFNDLDNFIKIFKGKYNEIDINNFIFKSKWSRKATLRLIELINQNNT